MSSLIQELKTHAATLDANTRDYIRIGCALGVLILYSLIFPAHSAFGWILLASTVSLYSVLKKFDGWFNQNSYTAFAEGAFAFLTFDSIPVIIGYLVLNILCLVTVDYILGPPKRVLRSPFKTD